MTAEVTVGYQPDELVIRDGLIYVANSGGYRKPNYDNTVSVIDIATMTQIRKIPVGINLHRIRADRYGKLSGIVAGRLRVGAFAPLCLGGGEPHGAHGGERYARHSVQ